MRQFRQVVLWPLQLAPLRAGAPLSAHWELLERAGDGNPWVELREALDEGSGAFDERRYRAFMSLLSPAQRFVYGEPKGRGGGPADHPAMRVFRRNDVAKARLTFPGRTRTPVTFRVAHVDLCFFAGLDIAVLMLEMHRNDLRLDLAQETLYRFGRAYPTHWDEHGNGGHCLEKVEWLAEDGRVLAVSDYEARTDYLAFVAEQRAPRFASHWRHLLQPLVPEHSAEKGLIRYRQVEHGRMPLLAYLALDDARALTRGDFARLVLVTAPGASAALPYSARYLEDFEARHCADALWDPQRDAGPGMRVLSSGQAIAMVGDAHDSAYVDADRGALAEFADVYNVLFLLPHLQRATLLMLSNRMGDASSRLDRSDQASVERCARLVDDLGWSFARFTHRDWFDDASADAQLRATYRMTTGHLGTDRLYAQVRETLRDLRMMLDTEVLRRQADRLSVRERLARLSRLWSGARGPA